jgi:MFS family permease
MSKHGRSADSGCSPIGLNTNGAGPEDEGQVRAETTEAFPSGARVLAPRVALKRWLSGTVVGIALASLFCDMSHETVTAVLPGFLASLGAASGALGTIEGFADGLSTLAKLWGGWLADRLSRRKPLCVIGYSSMALSPLVIAAASSWFLVLGGRLLAWVSRGLRTPARKALLAEAVTPEFYGRAFGFERAMDTTGAIVAPLLALLLLHIGMRHRFLIYLSAIPAFAAAFCILFFVKETSDRIPVRTPFSGSFRGFGRSYKEFLGAVGLFGLGDFADTFYILYAVVVLKPVVGAAEAATLSVAFYALHNVFYASCSYLGGWAADHTNKRALLTLGYASAGAAALLVIVGVKSYVGLALMFALGGIGVGIYEAVEDAIAADLLPSSIRGRGFGALAAVTGVGDWLSSLIVGWLWTLVGVRIAFCYAFVLMAGGALLMFHLSGPRLTWSKRTQPV